VTPTGFETLFGRRVSAREYLLWVGLAQEDLDLWIENCQTCGEEFIVPPEVAIRLQIRRCRSCRLENRRPTR
jgi:hypothetical protein